VNNPALLQNLVQLIDGPWDDPAGILEQMATLVAAARTGEPDAPADDALSGVDLRMVAVDLGDTLDKYHDLDVTDDAIQPFLAQFLRSVLAEQARIGDEDPA
jgi:hypothetical protein